MKIFLVAVTLPITSFAHTVTRAGSSLLVNVKNSTEDSFVDCDWETEETCYDDDYNPTSCAKVRLHGNIWNPQI